MNSSALGQTRSVLDVRSRSGLPLLSRPAYVTGGGRRSAKSCRSHGIRFLRAVNVVDGTNGPSPEARPLSLRLRLRHVLKPSWNFPLPLSSRSIHQRGNKDSDDDGYPHFAEHAPTHSWSSPRGHRCQCFGLTGQFNTVDGGAIEHYATAPGNRAGRTDAFLRFSLGSGRFRSASTNRNFQ